MVLKLFGATGRAGGTVLVATVLAEKKIPYEFVAVDMRNKEHKSEAHMEKQPFGQVPYIDDILYESRAICRYLIEKYPEKGTQGLLPPADDVYAKALFEQAASVEYANFHAHATWVIFIHGVINPAFGMPVNASALEAAKTSLDATLGVYENILAKQKYLVGDTITLGGVDGLTSKGPNVKRWWEEISNRPSYLQWLERLESLQSK
ncbi:Glutathione S-transferase [Mycena kentingensis (nom. inval.)]|nr:Glutathione S-transferase [Mycena kentingensis (nom. inval.)]